MPLQLRPEQTAIAEVLSDMDAELAPLEQRRDKTRLLNQGMMQELLTGKTRLAKTREPARQGAQRLNHDNFYEVIPTYTRFLI